ncbi:MAG: mechanosensitive ion channel [Ignavibacteriaceae bacterium]|nr:mechanosensitive ion channel [Ignavibacteriaceae bacterium]
MRTLTPTLFFLVLTINLLSQGVSPVRYPVVLDSDTIIYISAPIGIFTPAQRAEEISKKLETLLQDDGMAYDSLTLVKQANYYLLKSGEEPIMTVTSLDAENEGMSDSVLAEVYKGIIISKLNSTRQVYSNESLTIYTVYSLLYLAGLLFVLLLFRKISFWLYRQIESPGKEQYKTVKFRDKVVISSEMTEKFLLVAAKGARFILSLYALYIYLSSTIQLWPHTRKLDIQPFIKTGLLIILYTALLYAIIKGIHYTGRVMIANFRKWKGTKLRSLEVKNYEILSADRMAETLTLFTKVIRFLLFLIVIYTYLAIVFSLFAFSRTWADKLFDYIMNPLEKVWFSFLGFLPNLFFIIVLVFVFRYLIKVVRFIFLEIDKGALRVEAFHQDWAMPTFKIVRFMILVLAAIIIFPYLPGSDSPFFQGISVFLGILFSLGSSSAIANMVSGVVLTYMRPFKIGDRVKIADTMGDVVEKTLLVTRVRTVKNVDITIPNSMVLGSHIINFSSSAEEKGLILHTTVTIGYDVPWKQVHSLLLSAADETDMLLKEPKPFVLQTSLDDFYVSYELNIYTRESGRMAAIYSVLHSKIQDKFNEAGVEIMSPHYGAHRDGNQTTIPQDYLPKDYKAPSFNIFTKSKEQ